MSQSGPQRTSQPARRMCALKGKAEVGFDRFDFPVSPKGDIAIGLY